MWFILCLQGAFLLLIVLDHPCYLGKAKFVILLFLFLGNRMMAFQVKERRRMAYRQNRHEMGAALTMSPVSSSLTDHFTLSAKCRAKHLINAIPFDHHLSSRRQVLL